MKQIRNNTRQYQHLSAPGRESISLAPMGQPDSEVEVDDGWAQEKSFQSLLQIGYIRVKDISAPKPKASLPRLGTRLSPKNKAKVETDLPAPVLVKDDDA